MRATIHNYLEAAKARREENGEKGFSLIELIVVVVILGILVAIAIPVFGAIQENAKTAAAQTSAANGATSVAAAIANSGADSLTTGEAQDVLDQAAKGGTGTLLLSKPAAGADVTLQNYCVTNGAVAKSGPAC